MAVSTYWYGGAALGQFSSTAARRVDWAGDTIKLALLDATYTPDQDADTYWSDVSSKQVSGTGYTAGGQTIANRASSYNASTNTVKLDGDDVTWSPVTVTARWGVIYKDTGSGATSPLLAYVDLGGTQTIAGAAFSVVWSANGILTATAGAP